MTGKRLFTIAIVFLLAVALLVAIFYGLGSSEERVLFKQEFVKSLIGFLFGGFLAALAALAVQLYLVTRQQSAARVQTLEAAVGRVVDAANVLRGLAALEDAKDPKKTRALRRQQLADAAADLRRLSHEIGNFGEAEDNTLIDGWPRLRGLIGELAGAIKKIELEFKTAHDGPLSRALLDPDEDRAEIESAFFQNYDKILAHLRGQIAKERGLQHRH